jgi:signal transduction histidine kinase
LLRSAARRIRTTPDLVKQVGAIVAVSLGYYILAYVGTILNVPPSGNSIVWLATAFLAGVFFVTPARGWWTFPLGLVPVHLWLVWHIDARHPSLVAALTQISGNIAMAAAMVLVMRRVSRGPVRFDTFQAMLTYILVAGVGVTACVSALILSVHQTTGWSHDFWLSWRQWMLAGVFPAITLTPLVVLTGVGGAENGRVPRSRVEALGLSALLFVVVYLAFGERGAPYGPALRLAPLPLLLWAAARCGVWGVCLSLLVAAAAIILRALGGAGPFASGAAAIGVLSLQVYLIVISIPLLLLAALMEERRRAEEDLRRSEQDLRRSEARMAVAAASTDTGLWQWDPLTRTLWLTEHCRRMFGMAKAGALTPLAFVDIVHPDDQPRVRAALTGAMVSEEARVLTEIRMLPEGDARWFIMRTRGEVDASGELVRVSGVFRDVTQTVVAQRQAEGLSTRLLTLQEEERRSIAQALHDSTTQHLVAAGLTLGMLERRAPLTEDARLLIDDMRTLLADATKELRTFTYLLRPPELERQGLGAVLRRYVEGFGLRTGLLARARLSEAGDELPREQQRELLRIVQEALANVHRHAAATQVSITLRRHGKELHLIIRDDGRGFDGAKNGAPTDSPLGVGLPGMAARMRQLGGKFGLRSSPRGTTVHVALPLGERKRRRRGLSDALSGA